MTHTGFPTTVLNVDRDESKIEASIASGVVLFFPPLSLFLLLLHPQAEINKLSKKLVSRETGWTPEKNGGEEGGKKNDSVLVVCARSKERAPRKVILVSYYLHLKKMCQGEASQKSVCAQSNRLAVQIGNGLFRQTPQKESGVEQTTIVLLCLATELTEIFAPSSGLLYSSCKIFQWSCGRVDRHWISLIILFLDGAPNRKHQLV